MADSPPSVITYAIVHVRAAVNDLLTVSIIVSLIARLDLAMNLNACILNIYLFFHFHLTSDLILGARVERFTLNPMTGELKTASPLRLGERSEYTFMVTAADHGTPGLSSTCRLQIQVNTDFAFLFSPQGKWKRMLI